MLGAIAGDIIGSRFEFDNYLGTDFELFTSECDFTDDTVCTVAVADAILTGVSFERSLLRWCRKYTPPKGGYGSLFARWIHSADLRQLRGHLGILHGIHRAVDRKSVV